MSALSTLQCSLLRGLHPHPHVTGTARECETAAVQQPLALSSSYQRRNLRQRCQEGSVSKLAKRRHVPSGLRVRANASSAATGMAVETSEENMRKIEEIIEVLTLLREKRDMPFNEVRLTVMIEDPREAERKKKLGLENESGVSAEELGAALVDVNEGRVPTDQLALNALHDALLAWPGLTDEPDTADPGFKFRGGLSPYAALTKTGVDARESARMAGQEWDDASEVTKADESRDLGEVLPPVMGFSVLYLVSFIPVIIVGAVIVILFVNSLQ